MKLKSLLKQLKDASDSKEGEKNASKVLRCIFELLSTRELEGMAVRFTRFIREHSAEWQRLIDDSASARSAHVPGFSMNADASAPHQLQGSTVSCGGLDTDVRDVSGQGTARALPRSFSASSSTGPRNVEYDLVSGQPIPLKRPRLVPD